jgi:phage terminase Nu1 subunit (DNA packaging protein)
VNYGNHGDMLVGGDLGEGSEDAAIRPVKTLVSTSELQRLVGLGKPALTDLAARGIVKRGAKRGTYELEQSVRRYVEHLRSIASARGGEDAVAVRAKLASAQADLAAEKVKAMRGQTLPTVEVEAFWAGKLRAFRNRILSVPSRVRDLSARQRVTLTQELRAALTELADDKAA